MFSLHYQKPGNETLLKQLDSGDIKVNLKQAQNYIPTYKRFFSINEKTFNTITLNNKLSLYEICKPEKDLQNNGEGEYYNKYICNLVNEKKEIKKQSVFFKFSPLLDPIKYCLGKYEQVDNSCNIFNLPKYDSKCYEKIEDINNSAYVDTMFSYLTSMVLHHHNYVHGLDFYGSFLGIKDNFIINVIDEIELLFDSEYFEKQLGELYHIDKVDQDKIQFSDTRNRKKKLNIMNTNSDNNDNNSAIELDDIDTIDNAIFDGVFKNTENEVSSTQETTSDVLEVFSAEDLLDKKDNDAKLKVKKNNSHNKNISNSSSESCSSRSSNTSNENDSDSESDSNDGDGNGENNENDSNDGDNSDDSDDESEIDSELDSDMDSDETSDCINMVVHNFPVQMIALEKCDATLDSLMNDSEKELEYDEWKSILMQIIMMLLTYQKAFAFTHNDLHTNNVMYVKTDKQFLNYKYNGSYYRVPTFGRLFKLIDFGRAIYKFNGQTFCSDSFHPKGDAATQYNCEPYYDPEKSRVDPNYSFDLCRLACSMFDYFVEDIEEFKKMKMTDDPIAYLIGEWCTDDKGRNVLYKANNEERYPDFKLYKMIARKVHNHTPENQLKRPLFDGAYKMSKKKLGKKPKILDIDAIPIYV